MDDSEHSIIIQISQLVSSRKKKKRKMFEEKSHKRIMVNNMKIHSGGGPNFSHFAKCSIVDTSIQAWHLAWDYLYMDNILLDPSEIIEKVYRSIARKTI